MHLLNWNINGIRAAIKKGFWEKVQALDPDILTLQEIKCGADTMENLLDSDLLGYSTQFGLMYNCASNRKGYSGTAILYKKSLFPNPTTFISLNNEKFDIEGRLCGFTFQTTIGTVTLVNCYYPQGGREGRVAYKIEFYQEILKLVQQLKSQEHKVILTGDFNTTFTDIDLARPKENRETTGCLPEEREALSWFIQEGLVDIFRHLYPDKVQYSYWDQITRARERNVGWRIDMYLIDSALIALTKDAQILDQIMGSDHCPISLHTNIIALGG